MDANAYSARTSTTLRLSKQAPWQTNLELDTRDANRQPSPVICKLRMRPHLGGLELR